MIRVFLHGEIEMKRYEGEKFKINGQACITLCRNYERDEVIQESYLDEFFIVNGIMLCRDIILGALWEVTHRLIGEV